MPEQGKHKDMHTRKNGLVAVTEQACLLNTKKAIFSSLTLAAHEATLTCPEVLSSWSLRRWTMQIVMYRIRCKSGLIVERTRLTRGGSRIFFRRGCTRLLLYFNTNKPHNFFLQNTSCIRKPQVTSGEGAHPLHPPPRSVPAYLSKSWSQGKNTISSFLLRSILVSVGSSTTILGTRNDRTGWAFGKSSCNPLDLYSKCERRTIRFDTKSFRYKLKQWYLHKNFDHFKYIVCGRTWKTFWVNILCSLSQVRETINT